MAQVVSDFGDNLSETRDSEGLANWHKIGIVRAQGILPGRVRSSMAADVIEIREGQARLKVSAALRNVEKVEHVQGVFIPRSKRIIRYDLDGEPYVLSPCVPLPDLEADATPIRCASPPNP